MKAKKDPEFPNRLKVLMDKKDITRAELARRIWGEITDERGYPVAKNRQIVGRYLDGKSFPSDKSRRLLTKALGVNDGDLFPNSDPVNRVGSGIVLTPIDNQNSTLSLTVEIPTALAAEIIKQVAPYAK